jgi:hypothetical protein
MQSEFIVRDNQVVKVETKQTPVSLEQVNEAIKVHEEEIEALKNLLPLFDQLTTEEQPAPAEEQHEVPAEQPAQPTPPAEAEIVNDLAEQPAPEPTVVQPTETVAPPVAPEAPAPEQPAPSPAPAEPQFN